MPRESLPELAAPELIPAPLPLPNEPELALETVTKDEPPQPKLSFDPLFELFQDKALPDGLLLSAKPLPEQDQLLLELSVDVWGQMAAGQRQTLASSWLQSAFELDYASLQLVSAQGDLLGRSARVGGGMILFDLGLVG